MAAPGPLVTARAHAPPPAAAGAAPLPATPAPTVFEQYVARVLVPDRARLQQRKAALHEEDQEGALQHPCEGAGAGQVQVPGGQRALVSAALRKGTMAQWHRP